MQHNFPIGRRVLQGITLAAALASGVRAAQGVERFLKSQ